MTMVAATLSTELQNMTPSTTEASAITALTDAYGVFAADATALTPILIAGVNLGKAAMAPALVDMSVPGAGAAKMVAGIVAFWVAVAGGLTTSFAGATAIFPPANAGLQAALDAIFLTNTAGNLSLADAMTNVANAMHSQAIIGGTVTTAGPVVTPII